MSGVCAILNAVVQGSGGWRMTERKSAENELKKLKIHSLNGITYSRDTDSPHDSSIFVPFSFCMFFFD